MSVKKAKGKGKATAKRAAAKKAVAKESSPTPKKGKDIAKVREGIDNKIKNSAQLIANKVIEVAKTTGQLASARYLFEAVGLYPANERTEERPIETTMAHQLLTRMGLPLEPVVYDPDADSEVEGDAENGMNGAAEDTEEGDPAENAEDEKSGSGEREE